MEQCSEDSLLYYFGDFPPERVENTFKNWKKKKKNWDILKMGHYWGQNYIIKK